MTHDDSQPDEPGTGRPDPADDAWDEDKVWAEIIANYGEEPQVPPPAPEPGPSPEPALDADPTSEPWDPTDSWEDEGHFIPPEPPPLPHPEPRRALAWAGLVGAPAVLLAGALAHLPYPEWLTMLLVLAFLGGFGYLIATMPRNRDDGDDGAVL
ncbi:MAG TPA: hypothetical protein VFJ19_14730 [Nocardioidaceae bacterium]|nr:hypothetical protein [Nocardioidaceae bacterium]